MSYTDKDCRTVFEDAHEDGVKQGLNIKTSPRKGYSVHKREIDLHKVRGKQLFTPKQLSCENVVGNDFFLLV